MDVVYTVINQPWVTETALWFLVVGGLAILYLVIVYANERCPKGWLHSLVTPELPDGPMQSFYDGTFCRKCGEEHCYNGWDGGYFGTGKFVTQAKLDSARIYFNK